MIHAILLQFEEHDRRIFWVLALLLIACLSFYIYFLSVSVVSVIARKTAEQATVRLSADVSMLESEYVVLDRVINLSLAHERGFSDITAPRYISQNTEGGTLTLRDEGR
jgi:hypothetical protein